ncbi:hypothetical protein BJY52DRAFT_1155142 [Lactarius psammicola]|nr:hypothetical protein BJY52DRAFT_1155142 [Lactarius psammicola]
MTTTADFTSIPNLNYDLLAPPETRPALINVGFLQPRVPADTHRPLRRGGRVPAMLLRACFFALPQERKDALQMTNSPQFLGYSRLGVERTRGTAAQSEQFDLATLLENGNSRWTPGEPEYLRLWGSITDDDR